MNEKRKLQQKTKYRKNSNVQVFYESFKIAVTVFYIILHLVVNKRPSQSLQVGPEVTTSATR